MNVDVRPSAPLPTQVLVPWWVTLLDVVIAVTALLLLSAVLFEGVRVRFGDMRISATSVAKLGGACLALLVARHALFRRPAWPTRLASALRHAWHEAGVRQVLPWVATSRLTVLAAAYTAVLVIGYPEGAPPFRASANEFNNLLARWDTGWYLGIADSGYEHSASARRQTNVAFFPAYPLTVRAVAGLLGARWGSPDYPVDTFETFNERRGVRMLLSGWLVSMTALVFGMGYLFRLARDLTGSEEAATRAVILASVYPFAFFFGAVYTESLYLLAIVAAVYHFRERQWIWSAVAGLVAGLTRPNGCLLSIPLAILALHAWRQDGYRTATALRALATASMPGIGMLIFTWWLHAHTGEWFIWLEAHAAWGRQLGGLHVLLVTRWQHLNDLGPYGYTVVYSVEMFNMAATAFVLAVSWPVARRYGAAYAALLLLTVVPPLFMGGFLSLGRITATLFPVFIYLGARLSSSALPHVALVMFGLQVALAVMHYTWRQVY